VFKRYPETAFGGEFPLQANYKSPYIQELIAEKDGWMIWPVIPFNYSSINYELQVPAPAPPSLENWLGTDDQGRDVLARVIYGFRISVLFAITLTLISSVIGVRSPGRCRASMAVGWTWSGSACWRSGRACRCSTC